jgi:hypothetical protein
MAGTLIAATIVALFGRRSIRVFCSGFAVAGWIYFSLTFTAIFGLRDVLLTSQSLCWVQEAILEENKGVPQMSFSSDGSRLVTGTYRSLRLWKIEPIYPSGEFHCFHDIGHSLWTIIVAYIGGFAAMRLGRSEPIHAGCSSSTLNEEAECGSPSREKD